MGPFSSVDAAAAGWRWVAVHSCGSDLQERSCSYVSGKCALLTGDEPCCKVLSCSEAVLHTEGGALGEDHNK